VVPSYNSLAVYYDPIQTVIPLVIRRIEEMIDRQKNRTDEQDGKPRTFRVSVVYDGIDLERVAAHNGLTTGQVKSLHTAARYTVAMIGFLPHFPYLIGLDERLATPRLVNPRTRVPAGSVAIGGAQTGIYPTESPGGWNILGCCDISFLVDVLPGDILLFEEAQRHD
jgi:inhibitor of KinA